MSRGKYFLRRKSKSTGPTPAVEEAKICAIDATARLAATQARWPEIRSKANRLAIIRQRNNFAEGIRSAVLGEEEK